MHRAPVRSESFSEAQYPSLIGQPGQSQQLSDNSDSTNRYLTDGARECAIALAGEMVEQHIRSGNRDRALVSLERMRTLLLGRSPAQVQKMEKALGLA